MPQGWGQHLGEIMSDEDLLSQAATLPVIYFDGFGAYRKINGLLRCVGFTLNLGGQYNVLISLAGAEEANRRCRIALDGKATSGLQMWSGTALAH